MSSILYGNFRLEVAGRSGSRVDRLALRPPPGLVPRPRAPVGSVPASPAGRDEQLDVVHRAVRAHRPVGFFGTCGYGKTTLLRYVAATALAEGFAQPGVYLQAGPGGLRDLLHRLVGELYTADEPVKLPPDQCAEVLGQVHTLVAADDVALTRGQADYLQTVLPECSLLLSSRHPVLGQDDSHQLGGLPEEAALQLVIDDLGRPLSPGETADVRRLVGAADGRPLHLRQAAALVREGQQSFAALAERAERDPEALDRLSVGALAERYRQGLAILALAAGALLPIGLVAAMGGIAEIGECLSLLRRRGLAEQEGDRFGLPVCKAERYREMLVKDVHHAAAMRELTSWLTTANPAAPDSICAASAALAVAEWAAEGSDWAGVIEVIRVAEPILTLAGHWEASRQALTAGLHAAVAAGDHLGEALFAHQQGTLALCLDELTSAHQLLTHALRLREQHGDHEGAAITRHNLEVLQPSAPKPGKPRPPRSLRKLLAVAGSGAVAVLAITAGVVKALPSSPTAASAPTSTPSPTPSPSPTIEHHHHHRGKPTGSGTSAGGNTDNVVVPDVIGQTRRQAVGALRNLGLTVTVKLTSACPVDTSGTVIAENPAGGTSIPAGSGTGITVCNATPPQVVVPDVTGQTQAKATATLQSLGLTVSVTNSTGCDPQLYGTVLTQQPTGGISVAVGSRVGITVCDVVVVPDVTGQTQSQATTTLQGLGLTVSVTSSTGCDPQLYGTVLIQQPVGGTSVAAGSAVTITVCSTSG